MEIAVNFICILIVIISNNSYKSTTLSNQLLILQKLKDPESTDEWRKQITKTKDMIDNLRFARFAWCTLIAGVILSILL